MCPLAPPTVGTACATTFGLICEYGDALSPSCDALFECYSDHPCESEPTTWHHRDVPGVASKLPRVVRGRSGRRHLQRIREMRLRRRLLSVRPRVAVLTRAHELHVEPPAPGDRVLARHTGSHPRHLPVPARLRNLLWIRLRRRRRGAIGLSGHPGAMALLRPLVGVVIACLACGGASSTLDASTDVDAESDTDGSFFSFGDAADDYDAPIFVMTGPDVGLDDGGGIFMCGDCACDGRTHYCYALAEGAPILGDDAADCSGCIPLPDACVPANCDCLPTFPSCWCHHASDGDGLIDGCLLP